jgi:predicted TIM-barrel enzyme
MLVTIHAFRDLAYDANGQVVPIGRNLLSKQVRTADGAATAMPTDTQFIRVSTDSKIHINPEGAATTSDFLMHAGTVEWFHTRAGLQPNILTAA